jgi:hypothetical protein
MADNQESRDLGSAAANAAAALNEFAETIRDSEQRDVAGHPDLAELNAQLDGYYGEDEA